MESTSNEVRPAFFSHKSHERRGPKLVSRTSAVFYFVSAPGVDGVRTQIHFLNYWREKSGISALTQRLTLRALDGRTIHVDESRLERRGAQVIEIDSILERLNDSPSEGSVELEFFAERSLGIAFPALVVRYLGRDWHTVAHTSQRFYSEQSGDDHVGQLHLAEEGNITIHEDPSIEPFFFIHNGPTAVDPRPIEVDLISDGGCRRTLKSEPIGWAPHQTRRLMLRDLVDFRDFLAGNRGTFSMRIALAGVFPRLIGGQERDGVWSIDHTNFSATTGPVVEDVIPVEEGPDYGELVFNVPNNSAEGWRCFLDVYPTYPADDGYTLEVRSLDLDGEPAASHAFEFGRSGENSFPRIVVDNADLARSRNLSLSYRHQEFLPRRFHTGIHYQIGNGLPGFLTSGPSPASTGTSRTRWFPVFEEPDSRNYIMMAHLSSGLDEPQAVVFDCLLFNCAGDEPLDAVFRLEAFQQKCVSLIDLFPNATTYLRGGPGWVYLVAKDRQRSIVHYASVRGKDSVAVCHAF